MPPACVHSDKQTPCPCNPTYRHLREDRSEHPADYLHVDRQRHRRGAVRAAPVQTQGLPGFSGLSIPVPHPPIDDGQAARGHTQPDKQRPACTRRRGASRWCGQKTKKKSTMSTGQSRSEKTWPGPRNPSRPAQPPQPSSPFCPKSPPRTADLYPVHARPASGWHPSGPQKVPFRNEKRQTSEVRLKKTTAVQ